MPKSSPRLTLPIDKQALQSFETSAKKLGLSLDAYLHKVALEGFRIPLPSLIATTLQDAERDAGLTSLTT